MVLLTVSLWEVWEVCLCQAGEDRESGWSDGPVCVSLVCLELRSLVQPATGASPPIWTREPWCFMFALDLVLNLWKLKLVLSLCVGRSLVVKYLKLEDIVYHWLLNLNKCVSHLSNFHEIRKYVLMV